jgi:hypothetical protein
MSSSTGVDAISSQAIVLEGDATGFSNSTLRFIDVNFIGQDVDGTGESNVIHINGDPTHIIRQGSADIITAAYVENVNETLNFTTLGAGATMFENNNDYIYIGADLNFTQISFSLSITSDREIRPKYYYCNNVGNYVALGGVTDTTNKMRQSGSISFTNPTDRGKCNTEFDGTPFSDTTDYTYIAIKREQNTINREPVENLITIGGANNHFLLAEDYMKLNPIDTEPQLCTAAFLGAIYFDISEDGMCQCSTGGWELIKDGSACT